MLTFEEGRPVNFPFMKIVNDLVKYIYIYIFMYAPIDYAIAFINYIPLLQ